MIVNNCLCGNSSSAFGNLTFFSPKYFGSPFGLVESPDAKSMDTEGLLCVYRWPLGPMEKGCSIPPIQSPPKGRMLSKQKRVRGHSGEDKIAIAATAHHICHWTGVRTCILERGNVFSRIKSHRDVTVKTPSRVPWLLCMLSPLGSPDLQKNGELHSQGHRYEKTLPSPRLCAQSLQSIVVYAGLN